MSFSQHKANDGHWQSRYFGRGGVVARDLAAFEVAKDAYFNGAPGACDELIYRDALLACASTVYSARMFRPLWAPRTLVGLMADIEAFAAAGGLTSPQKECVMAFQMYLFNYDTWCTGEVGRTAKAVALGREILADETAPLATRLLTMARMSNIHDYVSGGERKLYRQTVLTVLKDLTTDGRLLGLDQDWKTVCRLGMLIGAWKYVAMAHKHDKSRDIRLKAYTQPGFVIYKLTGGIFGK